MFKVEKEILLSRYGKTLWMLRRMPSHAVHWLSGVYLPPHERLWVSTYFQDYQENNIVASRGTSKSFTHASLSAPVYDTLHASSTSLVVSASGFRGGKLLFEDVNRLFKGRLRSQRPEGDFLFNNVDRATKHRVVTKAPDMWYLDHTSNSRTLTIPTNNPEAMRGIRATRVIVDERNTFDGEVVQKVIRPMLNVGLEFRSTATGVGKNKVVQVSTIDYTFRDWYPEIEQQLALAKREYDAQRALRKGDFEEYEHLMNAQDGLLRDASFAISKVDYTDLLIPDVVTTPQGRVFEVRMPLEPGLTDADVKRYDDKDRTNYWYLYPVDKDQLEAPLKNGTMDEDLWLAEQRNVFIKAAGNVYPHELIVNASDRPIYTSGRIPGYENIDDDFYAPILYTCGDPCVMGVDYGRESDEFTMVVIRLGPLGKGKLDPTMTKLDANGRICLGETTWSSVIWAESWKKMTASEAAVKIREMYKRYNLIYVPTVGRGIGLDKGGGGGAVRDQLANPRPSVEDDPTWETPIIIFDPEDKDYAHLAVNNDPSKAWPGLELIKATNETNLESTMVSKALLQKKQLYIGHTDSPRKWAVALGFTNDSGAVDVNNPLYKQMLVGFRGIQRLKSQLVRLQHKVSETGVMRFIMPGDRELEAGKKDLYSAFIYATYMARKHLAGMTKQAVEPPAAQPIILKIGDRSKGQREVRSWTRIGWGGKNVR